ncbi:hypothetical protein Tco_0398474, partial [Tanacetum coccineum]
MKWENITMTFVTNWTAEDNSGQVTIWRQSPTSSLPSCDTSIGFPPQLRVNYFRALSLSFSQRCLAGSSFPLTQKVANSLVLRAAYANLSSDTNSKAIVKEAIISGESDDCLD